MSWYLKALCHFYRYHGRAPRKEAGFFCLFFILFSCTASIIDSRIGWNASPVVACVQLPALFAVICRRLHDAGYSGWWCLLLIVPLLGWLPLLLLCAKESQAEDNAFGPGSGETAEDGAYLFNDFPQLRDSIERNRHRPRTRLAFGKQDVARLEEAAKLEEQERS